MTSSPPPESAGHRFGARILEAGAPVELTHTDTDPDAEENRIRTRRTYPIRLTGVPPTAARLLTEELLSAGGEAAPARSAEGSRAGTIALVLLATQGQYRALVPSLGRRPAPLPEIAEEVDRALRAYLADAARTVSGARRSLVLGDRPRVMGVINVTPDSFSDGGEFLDPVRAVHAAERMVTDGAAILDVGGESTRPRATPVSPEVEWERIAPVLERLRGRISVPISVDTRHPEVAARAVEAGADFINDVEGLRSESMRTAVARTGAGVVVMHMRGTPATMQENLEYGDLRGEVFATLAAATEAARKAGVAPEKILVDPGLGFGKSAAQSLELLVHVGELRCLGYPLVVGASRKSFLGAALGNAGPRERLEAGLAAAVLAAERGVALVRTHDVRPTVQALKLLAAARALPDRGPATANVPTAAEGS